MFDATDLECHIADEFRITLPALNLIRKLTAVVGLEGAAKIWEAAEHAVMADDRNCIDVADVELAATQELTS